MEQLDRKHSNDRHPTKDNERSGRPECNNSE